jgi:type VI secretion system protein ImpH
MGAAVGHEADALALRAALAELAKAPYDGDFYQVLRRIECLDREQPRWGEARHLGDEPVRLGQDPDLSFAPAPIASCDLEATPPRIQVRLFGLLGPNGPMPLHFTEYVRERLRNHADETLSRFVDVLHHRLLALFYRAWAAGQPHVNRDRPGADRYAAYVGSLVGIGPAAWRSRDSIPDDAKLFHAGALVRHVRNADGLAVIIRQFFKVPVAVEEFVGHWIDVDARERTHVGRENAALGAGAVLGRRVWTRQQKFRLWLGPLSLAEYEGFLPGGTRLPQLVDWVRMYVAFELDWDVRLRLRRAEVPQLRLGRVGRLGWTTWLGARPGAGDADDLCLDAETFAGRTGVTAA